MLTPMGINRYMELLREALIKNICKLNFSLNHSATQRILLRNSSWINIISEDWMLQAYEKCHICFHFFTSELYKLIV